MTNPHCTMKFRRNNRFRIRMVLGTYFIARDGQRYQTYHLMMGKAHIIKTWMKIVS